MKFIIARHTATEWDEQNRIKGHLDVPLSSKGRQEAEVLANDLCELGIQHIVTSDLLRAYQTADVVNAKLHVVLSLGRGLRECSFGKLEGMTVSEIKEQYGDQVLRGFTGVNFPYDFRSYGGECDRDVFLRHLNLLKLLCDSNSFETVLLVGHSLGMSTLLHGLGYDSTIHVGEYKVIEYPVDGKVEEVKWLAN